MPRYKLLSTQDVKLIVPVTDPGTPGTRADVEPVFAGANEDGKFHFTIPPYDPATHHILQALHVSLFPKGPGGAAPVLPIDPAQIVAAPLHYSTGCAALTGGGTVEVDATEAPEGDYTAALVAEFDQ